MKHRILALLLALTMAFGLVACGSSTAEESAAPSADPSAAPSAEPIEVDLDQNIITFSTGLAPDEAVATINGQPLSADFFLYWLYINTNYYRSYGYAPDLYGDIILEESLTMASYYALMEQKAVELGCPLTDEQQAAIQAELDELGEEMVRQQQTYFGLTDDTLWDIQSLMYHYENLIEATVPAPTQEELNNYVYQAKHILICTAKEGADGAVVLSTGAAATNEDGTPFTGSVEEYNAAALAKAEDILAQIRAAEDPIATFDALMNEHSEDGRDTEGNLGSPNGYTTTTGKMVPEFEAGALALEPGQISEPIQSTYGYHIILRGQVEDIDSYAETYRESTMDALVNTWLEESEVVKGEALENLNVTDFYNRFASWQAEFSAKLSEEEANG